MNVRQAGRYVEKGGTRNHIRVAGKLFEGGKKIDKSALTCSFSINRISHQIFIVEKVIS